MRLWSPQVAYTTGPDPQRGHEATTHPPVTDLLTAEVRIVSVKHHPQKVLLRSPHPCSRGQFPYQEKGDLKYPLPHQALAPKKSNVSTTSSFYHQTQPLNAAEQASCLGRCFLTPHYAYENSLE